MRSRFSSPILLVVLSLAGFLTFASNFRSVRAYPSDNWTLTGLNITVPPGPFDLDVPGYPRVQVDSDRYGILPLHLMELSVKAMVCGWAALAVACSALYFLTKRFVWSRKKTTSIALLTVIGAIALTFATWFHQVRPHILDAEEVYSGYPFVCLYSSRGGFWIVTEWEHSIQWYGFIGNIAFYMWIIFAAAIGFTILPKAFSKLIHYRHVEVTSG